MIIWGSTGRDKTIGSGHFYCPDCRGQSPFSHQRVSRYFTLYFIPLFRLETLGEYIRCHRCNGEYDPALLQLSPQQIEAALQPWTCAACGNTNPADHDQCISCQSPRGAEPQPELTAE